MPTDFSELLESTQAPPMRVDAERVIGRAIRRRRLRSTVAVLASAAVLVPAAAALGWSDLDATARDEGSVGSSAASSTQLEGSRVTLDVGHCWIEYLRYDGRLWGLPFSKQFGWGGTLPEGWVGTGTVRLVAPELLRYHDDGGAVLDLAPAKGRSVAEDEGGHCA